MVEAAIFLLNKNIEKPNKTNEPPQQRDAAGQNNSPGRETDAPNNEGSSEDSAAKIIGRANYFPAVKRRAANERRSNGRTTKRSSGQARRTQNSEVKNLPSRARRSDDDAEGEPQQPPRQLPQKQQQQPKLQPKQPTTACAAAKRNADDRARARAKDAEMHSFFYVCM